MRSSNMTQVMPQYSLLILWIFIAGFRAERHFVGARMKEKLMRRNFDMRMGFDAILFIFLAGAQCAFFI